MKLSILFILSLVLFFVQIEAKNATKSESSLEEKSTSNITEPASKKNLDKDVDEEMEDDSILKRRGHKFRSRKHKHLHKPSKHHHTTKPHKHHHNHHDQEIKATIEHDDDTAVTNDAGIYNETTRKFILNNSIVNLIKKEPAFLK